MQLVDCSLGGVGVHTARQLTIVTHGKPRVAVDVRDPNLTFHHGSMLARSRPASRSRVGNNVIRCAGDFLDVRVVSGTATCDPHERQRGSHETRAERRPWFSCAPRTCRAPCDAPSCCRSYAKPRQGRCIGFECGRVRLLHPTNHQTDRAARNLSGIADQSRWRNYCRRLQHSLHRRAVRLRATGSPARSTCGGHVGVPLVRRTAPRCQVPLSSVAYHRLAPPRYGSSKTVE